MDVDPDLHSQSILPMKGFLTHVKPCLRILSKSQFARQSKDSYAVQLRHLRARKEGQGAITLVCTSPSSTHQGTHILHCGTQLPTRICALL